MKKMFTRRLMGGAFAATLAAGCVIGDGDHFPEPPLQPCRLYPNDIEKCGKPWSGHIVQPCGDEDSVMTRLHFDRPGVPDSLRANLLEMGNVHLFMLSSKNPYIDTAMVCDEGLCRELVTEFRIHDASPVRSGSGLVSFWEPENYSLLLESADEGGIQIDSVWKESCN